MKKVVKIISVFFIILASIIIIATMYYNKNYSEQDFETLMYNVILIKGANLDFIKDAIALCIIPIIVLALVLCVPLIIVKRVKKKIYFKYFIRYLY